MPNLYRYIKIGVSVCGVVTSLAACSALEVSDPTAIESESVDTPTGARDLWTVARAHLFQSATLTSLYESALTDETFTDVLPNYASTFAYLDRREGVKIQTSGAAAFFSWQRLRVLADVAIPRARAYSPPGAREVQLGELFAFRGYAATRLAESTCPGFPLREVKDFQPVYGPPLTTAQAFTQAVAEFDSALVYAGDSVRVLDFIRVGKARALLGLGRFAEAGAVAAMVTPGYEMSGRPSADYYGIYFSPSGPDGLSVSDHEGGVGADFVSANDPRIGLQAIGHMRYGDTTVVRYRAAKYLEDKAPIIVANDIEARLIQAEAALNARDATWLTILNDLRRDRVTPSLPELDDPVNFDDQVDLLFRERAFWFYATGHRLGDFRRLIQLYDRDPETLFPTGPYRVGGVYGTATSIPFNPAVESIVNPAVTGCTGQ